VTTSNKLDPTTSSILLAKCLAFASALNSPVNLNNPEQSKANYTARPNEQEPGAWQGSAILGTEEIRQDRNGQGSIRRIQQLSFEQKLWWCTPSPRLAILMIGFVRTES
jgi:hypothetical protein